jgi:hypothetical protein
MSDFLQDKSNTNASGTLEGKWSHWRPRRTSYDITKTKFKGTGEVVGE